MQILGHLCRMEIWDTWEISAFVEPHLEASQALQSTGIAAVWIQGNSACQLLTAGCFDSQWKELGTSTAQFLCPALEEPA